MMLGSVHSLGRQNVGCLGVRAGKGEGEVVCSQTNGTIETYSVHDHCCVHSWSLQSSDRLTCPCVYHVPSERYCAVSNGNEFLCWSEDAVSVGHPACSLPSHVHTLLTSSSLPHVVVVYSNGSISLVRGGAVDKEPVSLVGRVTRSSIEKPQLRGASLLCCGGEEWVMVVYSWAGQVHVGGCTVSGKGLGKPCTTRLHVERKGSKGELLSWCVCGENLIALWVVGTITSTSLLPLLTLDQAPPPSLVPHWCIALPSPPSSALLTTVSADYFALSTCRELSLWDTRYATCQARASSDSTYLQLVCISGFLCATGSEGVEVCRVQSGGGGVLASALGRKTTPPASSLLITPAWLEPGMDSVEWEADVQDQDRKEREVISTLLDSCKTPSLDSFVAAFNTLPLSPGLCYGEVVRRVLAEESFWAREPLTCLLEAHLCPPSLYGDVLDTAAERNDWLLVMVALQCVEGVPEAVLVRLLQQTLCLSEMVECYSSSVRRDQLLFLLLSHPRNDAMIQQPLSQMPFPLVMSLLQFLSGQVAMEALLTPSLPPSLTPSPPHLHYDVVLEWLALLLDVHFTQLVLEPDTRQLLTSLQSKVSKQVLFLSRLSPLQGLMQAPLTSPDPHWLYRVEKLDINV